MLDLRSLETPVSEKFLFIALAGIAFSLQLGMWLSILYLDQGMWFDVAVSISHGVFPDMTSPTPVHPGTAFLLPAALILQLPIDPNLSYHIAISLLMAVGITLSSYVCYLLRPKSLWWLGVFLVLSINVHYLDATVPSAVATILAALYVLFILYIRENGASKINLFYLGLCAGVLLATRIDTGLFFLAVSLPYIWYFARSKIILVPCIAAFVFAILDPYLYIDAYSHVLHIYGQMMQNRVTSNYFALEYYSIFLPVISFLFAFLYVFKSPHETSIPRDFLLWLLAISEVLCSLLFFSSYHPMRYFLPIMTLWVVFLILFVLEYVSKEPSFRRVLKRPEYYVVTLFLAFQLTHGVFFYSDNYFRFSIEDYVIDSAATLANF